MSSPSGVMFCQVPTLAEQVATGIKGESIAGEESVVDESCGSDESVGGDGASIWSTGIDPSLEASRAESEPLDVAPQADSSKPRAP
jgi:hypothetical protein